MASPSQGEGTFYRSPAHRIAVSGMSGVSGVLPLAKAADDSGGPAGTPELPQLSPRPDLEKVIQEVHPSPDMFDGMPNYLRVT